MFYLVFYVKWFRNDLCAFLNKINHFLSNFFSEILFLSPINFRYSYLSVTTEIFKIPVEKTLVPATVKKIKDRSFTFISVRNFRDQNWVQDQYALLARLFGFVDLSNLHLDY